MSIDLYPLNPADLVSPYEHIDPDGELLELRPADEQPVHGWDDDGYDRDER